MGGGIELEVLLVRPEVVGARSAHQRHGPGEPQRWPAGELRVPGPDPESGTVRTGLHAAPGDQEAPVWPQRQGWAVIDHAPGTRQRPERDAPHAYRTTVVEQANRQSPSRA